MEEELKVGLMGNEVGRVELEGAVELELEEED